MSFNVAQCGLSNILTQPIKRRASKGSTKLVKRMHFKILHLIFAAAFLICANLRADVLDHSAVEGSEVVVIDSQEVDLGDRSIIYNRIAPPTLRPQFAEVLASDSAPATPPSLPPLPTDETRYEMYSLSATVFDGDTSEIRWRDGDHENVVWLNFNILHFEDSPEIKTPMLSYGLFLIGTVSTRKEAIQANAEAGNTAARQTLPPADLPALAVAGPVARLSTTSSSSAARFLRALTDYYAAHATELKSTYDRRAAERQAAQDWAEAHPTPPQDTVVNFFPILEEPLR